MLARREHIFLEDIGSTLSHWSGTQVSRSATNITVSASSASGFDMAIVVEEGRCILAFDEWVEEFEDAELARRTFAAALDGTARLKVDTLSGRRWRWTLERLDKAGQWIPQSTIGHVIWRFWGSASVVYLRNNFAQR